MENKYRYEEDENFFVGPGDRYFNTPQEIVAEFNELAAKLDKQSAVQVALIDLVSRFAAKLICCGEISINDFRQSIGDALKDNDVAERRAQGGDTNE